MKASRGKIANKGPKQLNGSENLSSHFFCVHETVNRDMIVRGLGRNKTLRARIKATNLTDITSLSMINRSQDVVHREWKRQVIYHGLG